MKSTSLVWASAKARSALHYVAEESNSFFSPVNLRTSTTGGGEGGEGGVGGGRVGRGRGERGRTGLVEAWCQRQR